MIGGMAPGPEPSADGGRRFQLTGVSLCPGDNISARKRKYGRTGDAGTYIKPVLIQAAWNGDDRAGHRSSCGLGGALLVQEALEGGVLSGS